jgi:hypothetical protein
VAVGVRPALGQAAQARSLDSQRVGDSGAEPTQVAGVGHGGRPLIGLGLQVGQATWRPQGQKRGLQVADRAFDLALALGEAGAQDHWPQPQRPIQRGHLVHQPDRPASSAGHDPGVVVADDRLRQPAETLKAADQGRTVLGSGPGQGEHHPHRSRAGQGGYQPERLPSTALADRHPAAGMPPVDLGELAGQVGRALVAGRGHKLRAHPAQVVFEDRERAGEALASQPGGDHRRGDLRVLAQHRGDGVAERVELGAGRASRIPRWFAQPEQPVDGGAAHPKLGGDGRLAQALDVVETVDLGPVVHVIHPCLLALDPWSA